MKYLVTGTAGFIGHFTALKLVEQGHEVVGIDCINDYYDISVKYGRLKQQGFSREKADTGTFAESSVYPKLGFQKVKIEDANEIKSLFENHKFDRVIHLAAQAGVRYSLENPQAYIDANITATLNILEACRHHQIEHLTYASSSSVYGLNKSQPFSTKHPVDHPISLYAASKRSNELMAHTYSHLFGVPTTGLRFFTVYGPWGRPDMALFLFTKAILEKKPIQVFNEGKMQRDFTYVDDIVEGVTRVSKEIPSSKDVSAPNISSAPYRVFNIGNSAPVPLMDFIGAIEKKLGIEAEKNMLPMQPGDVPSTYADVEDLFETINFRPATSIQDGVSNFIDWYREFYQI